MTIIKSKKLKLENITINPEPTKNTSIQNVLEVSKSTKTEKWNLKKHIPTHLETPAVPLNNWRKKIKPYSKENAIKKANRPEWKKSALRQRKQRVWKKYLKKAHFFHSVFLAANNEAKPLFHLQLKYYISVRVTPNNIFCTLQNLTLNKTLIVGSAGKYKIHVSKKKVKYCQKLIIPKFIEELTKKLKKEPLNGLTVLKLIAPIRNRKHILRMFIPFIKEQKRYILFNTLPKKCFNGCRPAKKRHKKNKKFLIKK